MRCLIALVIALLLTACDREPKTEVGKLAAQVGEGGSAPTAAIQAEVSGTFSTNGALPTGDGDVLSEVDKKAVDELNIVAKFRVESAFAVRDVQPEDTVLVSLGGPGETDGLLLTVRYRRNVKSHKVPPANNGPELVANFDHTLDRILDELGVARRLPGAR